MCQYNAIWLRCIVGLDDGQNLVSWICTLYALFQFLRAQPRAAWAVQSDFTMQLFQGQLAAEDECTARNADDCDVQTNGHARPKMNLEKDLADPDILRSRSPASPGCNRCEQRPFSSARDF